MGYTHFDGVDAGVFKINGTQVTATAAELNKMDTVTATPAEIEIACDQAAGNIRSISKVVTPAACTDSTGASGYCDFATNALPANCIVLGWKAVTTAAWDDDTTAVLMVGIAGNTDLYSVNEACSVATVGTVGSVNDSSILLYNDAAATPRVTITGGSDFTAFVTAATPSTTVTMYYIALS